MVNTKYWKEAIILSYATKNDLDFITDEKKICDDGVTSVAERAKRSHIWYFSDDLIGLATFDDRISSEENVEIVEWMKRPLTAESKKSFNLNRLFSAFRSVRSMQISKNLLGGQQLTFFDLSPET